MADEILLPNEMKDEIRKFLKFYRIEKEHMNKDEIRFPCSVSSWKKFDEFREKTGLNMGDEVVLKEFDALQDGTSTKFGRVFGLDVHGELTIGLPSGSVRYLSMNDVMKGTVELCRVKRVKRKIQVEEYVYEETERVKIKLE